MSTRSVRGMRLAITLPLLFAGIYATPASAQAAGSMAQDAVAEPSPPDENAIVVTALRRGERLQDAPAAISVVTAEEIAKSGVVGLADVSNVVPSLRFEGGIRPGVPSIALRGIAAVQGGDAPVSIVVDGVQIPFLSLARMDLLDISSVEILKGPQGALYGRGAIAGAIVVNTRQPDDDLRISGRVIAQEGRDYQAIATVSGPVVGDLLYGKLTGSYQNRKGLLKNGVLNKAGDFVDQGTIEGELVLTPADGTRLQLSGTYTRGRNGTNLLELVTIDNLDDYSGDLDQNFENYDQRRLWRVSAKLDQETPLGDLTIVAQHARARDIVVSDLDYTQSPIYFNYNPQLDEATNVDARITSPTGGAFEWIVGGFYQYRKNENFINVDPDPTGSLSFSTITSYQAGTSKSWGVYAHATVNLPAGFSMIGALRYDRDKRFDELTNVSGTGISAPFDAWQPSATLKWDSGNDLMIYATYGQGFRSGGFNAGNLVGVVDGARRIYNKEVARNYEVGLKTQFLDRMVTLNAALFQTDYDDAQYQRTIIEPIAARFVTSIAKSRVRGVEADLSIRPASEVEIAAAYSLTDTYIEDFDGTSQYVGNALPNAYHDNQRVSLSYEPWFNDRFQGLFRIAANRHGRIYYDLANSVSYDPVVFVNARFGIQTDQWSLAIFGENLTDRRAPEFVFPDFFGPLQGRLANQPFHAGIEFNFNFGG